MLRINQVSNNKFDIVVPKGIRYIGDWTDYSLDDPVFGVPHILDKKIPGCGFTEYCIRCNLDMIICSPRRILLTNKEAQHPDDVYYFHALDPDSVVEYDMDLNPKISMSKKDKKYILSKTSKKTNNAATNKALRELAFKQRQQEVLDYITFRRDNLLPVKFLVTYDSFHSLKDILVNLYEIGRFHIVVDEFQSIFTDSRFKSTTEMLLLKELKDKSIRKVCFVSATPMIDSYLQQLDDFKDLPYFELDWTTEDPDRLISPSIDIRYLNSVSGEAKEIIDKYLKGKFEKAWVFDSSHPNGGYSVESKEAVFFVNSVNNIMNIITKNSLAPDQCNILCANTPDNIDTINRRLNKKENPYCGGWSIGSVPLKGEQHKMFTFCTRTVYLGSDFYSTNARTFVFSDANVDTLSVDITLDLPQILGRQRLIENPWRNEATIYIKPIAESKVEAKEIFDNRIAQKRQETNNIIEAYNNLVNLPTQRSTVVKKLEIAAKVSKYKDDYAAFDHEDGNIYPVENKLVMLAEIRAFEIQQLDYKDRFSVFNAIQSVGFNVGQREHDRVRWRSMPYFREAFRDFCNCPDYTHEEKLVLSTEVSSTFGYYYNSLTLDEIRASKYTQNAMDDIIKNKNLDLFNSYMSDITSSFEINKRYTRPDIKQTLNSIYKKYNLNAKAKASDLNKWFEIKSVLVVNPTTKKKENGFEILKLK